MKPITIAVLAALLAMNLFSFFLMRHDKQCGLFGGLGGTLGMFAFRHKTKHWYFRVFFPVLMILQTGIIAYLFAAGTF